MKLKERVMAAITLQEYDRTPCNLTLSYLVARYNSVTIEDYINNTRPLKILAEAI